MGNTKEINKAGYLLCLVAAATGVVDNIKYARILEIKPTELKRYFRKTADLSMCYAGFAQNLSFDRARGAGHAAFLSCAYDVVTDWGKPTELQTSYAKILRGETSPELTEMALGLLDHDTKGILVNDGLERGVVALEFVLGMMRVREIFDRKCDIRQLGLNLQIVDDVLDWENDSAVGDQNCLTNTQMRREYLCRLQNDFPNATLANLFPYGRVLIFAIKHAQTKASKMLASPEKYF